MGEAMPGMVLARSDGRRCMCVRAFVCVCAKCLCRCLFFFFFFTHVCHEYIVGMYDMCLFPIFHFLPLIYTCLCVDGKTGNERGQQRCTDEDKQKEVLSVCTYPGHLCGCFMSQ